jgi:hypothetical protein
MRNPVVLLSSVLLAAWLVGSCSVLAPESDRELTDLLELLPGIYAGTAPVPGARDGRTQEIFHKIAPIDASQFGARAFYYQLSVGGPDGQPLQQKIFAFKTNPNRPGNRMRAWVFSPGQEAPNLEQRPDSWFYLEAARLMSFPDGCAFRWKRVPGGFEGLVKRERCTFQSEGFGKAVSPNMRYAVFPDRLEWEETLYGPDGKILVSTGGNLIATRQPGNP